MLQVPAKDASDIKAASQLQRRQSGQRPPAGHPRLLQLPIWPHRIRSRGAWHRPEVRPSAHYRLVRKPRRHRLPAHQCCWVDSIGGLVLAVQANQYHRLFSPCIGRNLDGRLRSRPNHSRSARPRRMLRWQKHRRSFVSCLDSIADALQCSVGHVAHNDDQRVADDALIDVDRTHGE